LTGPGRLCECRLEPGRTHTEALSHQASKARTIFVVVAITAAALLGPATGRAPAAFTGQPGTIAFQTDRDGNNEIYTFHPGGNLVRLTNNAVSDTDPAWSPDGTKLVFVSDRDGNNEIYTMTATGSAQTRLTINAASDTDPSWSADGSQIVFASNRDGNFEIFKMNADGSAQTQLTHTSGPFAQAHFPQWSPDGSKIAYQSSATGGTEVDSMNPDGTNDVDLTNNFTGDQNPAWSPDGKHIAFERSGDVFTMNPDGSSQTKISTGGQIQRMPAWSPDGSLIADILTTSGHDLLATMPAGGGSSSAIETPPGAANDENPDWQPLNNAYPRPRGATPFRLPLVPAMKPCTAPSTAHAPPLSFPSCNAPAPESRYLTVGTPDLNGQGANAIGFVTLAAYCSGGAPGEQPPCLSSPGDQEDGALTISLTDVRCAGTSGGCAGGPLSDYTGNVLFRATFRITDKNNGPLATAPSANATAEDGGLAIAMLCAATGSNTVGSTCAEQTSLDALFGSGMITEQKRAVWQMSDSFSVTDGGADGDVNTTGDNTLFEVGGVFFP
jgi:Tol biopolymer transport system component